MKRILSNIPSRTSTLSSTSDSHSHSHSHSHPHHSNSFSSTKSEEDTHSSAIKSLETAPLSVDPVEFLQQALTPIFTYNPKHDHHTLQDVADYHIPRFFSSDYKHRANTVDWDMSNFINRINAMRKLVKKSRVRFLRHHIDLSRRQSMQRAAVALIYEVVVSPNDREEEVRLHNISIWQIKEGKIVEGNLVLDTSALDDHGPNLECTVS